MNSIKPSNLSVVILAAGTSARMGEFKPLMRLGDQTMIRTAIDLFRANHVYDIVVVTGHNHEMLHSHVENTGARPVFNPDYKRGMLSSIKRGVQAINPKSRGFFLLPADIPALRPSTIQLMIKKFCLGGGESVFIPSFNGKFGHPPLIPSELCRVILNVNNDSTLKDILFSSSTSMMSCNVHDRGILLDADDHEGFEEVRRKFLNRDVPDKFECHLLAQDYLGKNNPTLNHMQRVCEISEKIFPLVTQINKELVISASLLHDIKRREECHATAGAALLDKKGFRKTADIVSQHMDIAIDLSLPVAEKEVVYFADKLCSGDHIDVNYKNRFEHQLKKFPHAKQEITKRHQDMKTIESRITKASGLPVSQFISGGISL